MEETLDDYGYFFSCLEACMKRGRPAEQALAAECLPLFAAQLQSFQTHEFYLRFQTGLLKYIYDPTVACNVRGQCAISLAWLVYLGDVDDFKAIEDIMKDLEGFFDLRRVKEELKEQTLSSAAIAMLCDFLTAWSILYTVIPMERVDEVGQAIIPQLLGVLKDTNVDARMGACLTLSLIYERIRDEVNEDFKGPYYASLIEELDAWANGSNRHESKNNLKKQRQLFKDMITFMKTGEAPIDKVVKLEWETLTIESFIQLFYYQSFCRLLSNGLQMHLQENELLRSALGMEPSIDMTEGELFEDKASIRKRKFKARTLAVRAARDRRDKY